jgi:hypothetical protein
MKRLYAVIFVVIGAFLFQYFVVSLLMANDIKNIKNSLNRFYISGAVASFAGILEVGLDDISFSKISAKYYIPLVGALILFAVLYRFQFQILDKEYLKSMVENKAKTIFLSTEILKKTHDYEITKLAKNTIEEQTSLINKLNHFINDKY